MFIQPIIKRNTHFITPRQSLNGKTSIIQHNLNYILNFIETLTQ